MDFGWSWCANVGSWIVTNIPLWCADRYAFVGVGGIWNISVPFPQFYFESKTALKSKVLENKIN